MAYHTHVTEAFVLATHPRGEANHAVHLFTRELGLVRAFARSSRVERSKLRGLLQVYTHGTASLVRGREYWRLIGMAETSSAYYAMRDDRMRLAVLIRISNLLRRLLHGEEKNEALFALLIAAVEALTVRRTKEELRAIEVLAAGRILERLGHMPREPFASLLSTHAFDMTQLSEAERQRSALVQAVNSALRESGL